VNGDWEIADTVAQWWRPNFETFMYPFIPAHITRPKECKKLYMIQLPSTSAYSVCRAEGTILLTIRRGAQCTQEHEALGCAVV